MYIGTDTFGQPKHIMFYNPDTTGSERSQFEFDDFLEARSKFLVMGNFSLFPSREYINNNF